MTRAAVLVLMAAVSAFTPLSLGAQAAQPAVPGGVVRQDVPVRMGVTVQPDTVYIGDPFVVSIRVQAARGTEIVFPEPPDSTFAVQALDPAQFSQTDDTTLVDRTARYRVAAWDVGLQPVVFDPVTVRTGDSARQLPVENVAVFVASVLPADSSEHVPKPAREPFEFPGPWWLPWLLALLVAAIVGTLLWWLWKRRRRPGADITVDPAREAEEAFARIEAMHLIEAGERSRYVALVTEVLREYLWARDPAASTSLTTRELVSVLHGSTLVPVERLQAVLREADLVKFARRDVTEERAREIGAESMALVRHVEAAIAAALADAAAEAAADAQRGRSAADREAA